MTAPNEIETHVTCPDRRAQLAQSYFRALRESWHSFPVIMHGRSDVAALSANWELWLRIMFVYRPLGYSHLGAMAMRAVLYRFGFNAKPKRSMDQLVAIVALVARLSEVAA